MIPSYHKLNPTSKKLSCKDLAGLVLFIEHKALKKKDLKSLSPFLSTDILNPLTLFLKHAKATFPVGSVLSFDCSPLTRIALCSYSDPKHIETFDLLGQARKAVSCFSAIKPDVITAELRHLDGDFQVSLTDALVAAVGAQRYPGVHYEKESSTKRRFNPKLELISEQKGDGRLKEAAHRSSIQDTGTNLVRKLAVMAGNDLTCKHYVALCKELAGEYDLKFEFYSMTKLRKMGAGAFVAVAQGSDHDDAGIVKLTYKPKTKGTKKITLVGKGITFDTGGVNVKPGTNMFGMHGDMQGSAVALANIITSSLLEIPCEMIAYLAIADNAISAKAYRPNDVVTSYNGKTIEVCHTDAEGRMVLADTLAIASEETKPDFIMDFATLTGSCVRAIGTTYSGAFTNHREFHTPLIEAGRASGERVWPFPLDKSFAKPLKSDIADTKQCVLQGGTDHIEAASFLELFVNKVPWVHIDLSACENKGGLAHIPTEVTGYGVRLFHEFVKSVLNDKH